ncbi:uncharacterized protein LOC130803757 [Amaranthus tricolor]|uniref:uncharacterized protein LOC130803757 n=1 Tax=Amaranthus tricolor TaxID=29722 RepID=UPI0025864203|nr:uncharacterized protein LOC130803757 [Amaranthus tricolor]
MFHHHHQSYNVNSNIDNYSTPIRDESLDENELEYDDDDDDEENEGNDQDDQYGEDEGNYVHHVDATPIPSKKSWDLIEHIALVCSVMNTSTDPIVSTNQKIRVRWQKDKEAYEAARMERPHLIARRTANMLKCHWDRVAPACLKWYGSYDEALRKKKSDMSDEDVLKEAHLLHQRKHVVKSNQEKRLDQQPTGGVSSESSGKRSRTKEDSEPLTSEPQGGSSTRLEGLKKAKARMTGKMVVDQSIQALSAFGESLRLNSEIMEKTELQKQKEARKKNNFKWKNIE